METTLRCPTWVVEVVGGTAVLLEGQQTCRCRLVVVPLQELRAATPARSASRAATPARSASRAATTGQSAFVSPASPPQQQQATASSSGSVPQVPVAAAPSSAVAGSGTLSSDAALSVIQAQSSQIQAQSAQISELMQIVKGLGRLQEQTLAASSRL